MELSQEEREEYNRQQSKRRFIGDVNNNFGPRDYYVTATYDDEHLPPDYPAGRKVMKNYFGRLLYACPGLKAMGVQGLGSKTNRLHCHFVISGATPEIIREKWGQGNVTRIENLREENWYEVEGQGKVNHGRDYTGLATYMFNHWTQEQGKGKRWKSCGDIRPPEKDKPSISKRAYTVKKPPKAPDGYMLVKAKSTGYGYQYFKYVQIPGSGYHYRRC